MDTKVDQRGEARHGLVKEAGYTTVTTVNRVVTGGPRVVGEEDVVASTNLVVEVVVERVELLCIAHLGFLKDDAGWWLFESASHEMAIEVEAIQVAGGDGDG